MRDREYEDHEYRREARSHFVEAANGFHGVVSDPTIFLVGERGPELVHIHPVRAKGKKHKKGKMTELDMHFNWATF